MVSIPKWALKAFYGLIFAAFFFALGSLYESFQLWWQQPVEVVITNNSGQYINSLNLTYTGYLINGVINIKPPDKEKSIVVRYFQSGEGSFTLVAALENGQILSGTEGYVEAGYSINKTILPKEIK